MNTAEILRPAKTHATGILRPVKTYVTEILRPVKTLATEILQPFKTHTAEILQPVKTHAAEILQPLKYLNDRNTLHTPEKMNKFWDDLTSHLRFFSTQDIYKKIFLQQRF